MTHDQILNYGHYMTVGHGCTSIALLMGCQEKLECPSGNILLGCVAVISMIDSDSVSIPAADAPGYVFIVNCTLMKMA
jgi:hypothetical protein